MCVALPHSCSVSIFDSKKKKINKIKFKKGYIPYYTWCKTYQILNSSVDIDIKEYTDSVYLISK